jgi:hypothetical protein
MPALVRDDGVQREVIRVGISFECLGIYDQHILIGRISAAILGAASLTVKMALHNPAFKSDTTSDPRRPDLSRPSLGDCETRRRGTFHAETIPNRHRCTATASRVPNTKSVVNCSPQP